MTLARAEFLKKEWVKLQQNSEFILDETKVFKEWESQLCAQTKIAPASVQDLGKKVILDLVALQESIGEAERERIELSVALDGGDGDLEEVLERQNELASVVRKGKASIKRRIELLSVGDRANWLRLQDDKFLALRVGALGLKRRIRQKLQARTFEITALKKHETSKHKDSRKLTENAMANLKRREPALKKLVQRYNEKCREIQRKLLTRRVPRNAIGLREIDLSTIWQLDVDDDIWNDAALLDEEEEIHIPDWLGDDNMRAAIRNRVENERCKEEIQRLLRERENLRCWMVEEWKCTCLAESFEQTDWMQYQVGLRKEYLALLAGRWESAVSGLKKGDAVENWGPEGDILEAARTQAKEMRNDIFEETGRFRNDETYSGSGSEKESDGSDSKNETLIEAMYNLELDQLAAEYSTNRETL